VAAPKTENGRIKTGPLSKGAAVGKKDANIQATQVLKQKKLPNALFFQNHFYLCPRPARDFALSGVTFNLSREHHSDTLREPFAITAPAKTNLSSLISKLLWQGRRHALNVCYGLKYFKHDRNNIFQSS